MEELTYRFIMANREEFEHFLLRDDLKRQVNHIKKIDTAGAQILVGLITDKKIEPSDLAEVIQNELLFLGVK
jgi:hypothetical protein